jgi:hypothetical protein
MPYALAQADLASDARLFSLPSGEKVDRSSTTKLISAEDGRVLCQMACPDGIPDASCQSFESRQYNATRMYLMNCDTRDDVRPLAVRCSAQGGIFNETESLCHVCGGAYNTSQYVDRLFLMLTLMLTLV